MLLPEPSYVEKIGVKTAIANSTSRNGNVELSWLDISVLVALRADPGDFPPYPRTLGDSTPPNPPQCPTGQSEWGW